MDDILGQLQEVLDDLQDVPQPFDDLMPKVHEKLDHLKEEIPKLLELPLEELLPKLRMKMDVLTEFLESFVEENDLPFGNLLELLQMLPGPFQDLQEKLQGVNEKLDLLKKLLESFVGNLGPVGALLEIELGKFSDELDLADLVPVILAQLQQKLDGLEDLPEQVDTLMPEIRKKLDHLQEELPKLVRMPLDKLIPKLQKKMTKLLDWLENLIDGVDLPFENLNVAFRQIPNPSAKLKEVLDVLIDVKENLGKMLEELTISVDLGIAVLSPLQKLPDPIQSLEQLLSMLQDAGKRLDVLLGPFEGLLQLLEPLKALKVLKHDIGNILDHLLSLLKLSQSLMDNVEETAAEGEANRLIMKQDFFIKNRVNFEIN